MCVERPTYDHHFLLAHTHFIPYTFFHFFAVAASSFFLHECVCVMRHIKFCAISHQLVYTVPSNCLHLFSFLFFLYLLHFLLSVVHFSFFCVHFVQTSTCVMRIKIRTVYACAVHCEVHEAHASNTYKQTKRTEKKLCKYSAVQFHISRLCAIHFMLANTLKSAIKIVAHIMIFGFGPNTPDANGSWYIAKFLSILQQGIEIRPDSTSSMYEQYLI